MKWVRLLDPNAFFYVSRSRTDLSQEERQTENQGQGDHRAMNPDLVNNV